MGYRRKLENPVVVFLSILGLVEMCADAVANSLSNDRVTVLSLNLVAVAAQTDS